MAFDPRIMLLKRFYINLSLRLVLILANLVLLAFAVRDLFSDQLLFTFIVLSGILILQVLLLFLYIKKTNRQLTRLVLSVTNQDFSQSLDHRGTPHQEFQRALNSIIEQYQSVYLENESQSFLMQHLVQTIPAGILLAKSAGTFMLKNKAMENLLDLSGTRSFTELNKKHPDLRKLFDPPKPGSHTLSRAVRGEQKKLSVNIREIRVMNQFQILVLVQDISREVEAGEVDAIQRLLRILTHEIRNSLTPVQTLTETISMIMTHTGGSKSDPDKLTRENFDDILDSVQAIRERTEKLDQFISRFRKLTRMPENLELTSLRIRDLFDSVCRIMQAELSRTGLQVNLEREDMQIQADAALMEQVIINLLTNALTAMSGTEDPVLELSGFNSEGKTILQVRDNGSGISPEKLPHIFMPFYSTKEEASGIGLSFVKQVVRLHGASIQVQSEPGAGSSFIIRFEGEKAIL
jgi:signal transduction histidine kinase